MAITTDQIGTAVASPTKNFFVRMLTRDIELQDAILDLLDNCVDGILRSCSLNSDHAHPYTGYHATITIAADHFIIDDNCGGIPIEVAKKYAFAMGKPAGSESIAVPATVGMYGIGMKRAIFKIGTDALVESRNDTGFIVEFTPDWMKNDIWDDLPMHALPEDKLPNKGTSILVEQLNAEVAAAFSDTEWVEGFRRLIARHYSIIIDKGFQVTVGTPDEITAGIDPIAAEGFKLLRAAEIGEERIEPYIYTGELNGVNIEIYAGLYRQLLSEEEADEEEETRGITDDAGWTIACNDRVVIWKDKTRLTGWGEATVPNYHGQFIAITGIVMLRSDDAKNLPLTTTKRGIDASANLYSEVKDLMREATKSLTSFTNKWKKFPGKLEEMYKASEYVTIPEIRALAQSVAMTPSRKIVGISKYEPRYPEPAQEKTSLRVSFVAPKTDIALLAEQFFGDEKVKPGEVGLAVFEDAAAAAKKSKKK